MSEIAGMLEGLAKPAELADGDYHGPDGLLYCGKCHAPKETLVDLSDDGDGSELRRVRISCLCQDAEIANEVDQSEKQRFAQVMDKLLGTFNISEPSYSRCTFAADDSPDSKISVTCRRYAAAWERVKRENIGLLIYGSVGTGKSYYACAIANALIAKRVPAAVTNFPRLLNILQGTRDRQAVIDHLQSYELLVLDDLGVERDTSYAAEQVYSIVDVRARSKLPLIVTTNLTVEELKSPTTVQQQRIYDRISEMCPVPLKMVGSSRRSGNAAARLAAARKILGQAAGEQ